MGLLRISITNRFLASFMRRRGAAQALAGQGSEAALHTVRGERVQMQIRPGIELAGLSDLGCQRENNEDRYSYWEPGSDAQFALRGRLVSVADGMGGYEGGQEASRIAVETVENAYANNADADPQSSLLSGFRLAHQEIQKYAEAHPALEGMGTTCTSIALLGKRLYFAHVGDSRLYLVRGSSISRLTQDHSYVSRLVAHGVISAEEAESHPQRHILTAALGAGSEVEPDVPTTPVDLRSGDNLVLCTDGLWGLVHDDEIQKVVAGNPPQEACQQLVQMARDRGGPDNITLQILRVS
jgi:PPM family protein phosphatase